MMKALLCLGAGVSLSLLILPDPACADATPPLDETRLYTQTAHDCRTVDLTTWTHPTKQVLERRRVVLEKLQLCNGSRYPIFTVHFKYDPRGLTTDYFHPLYAEMANANGFWPFSFVDTADDVIIDLLPDRQGNVTVNYEDYREAVPDNSGNGKKS